MRKTFSEIKTQFVLGFKVLKLVFEASPKWASFYFGTSFLNSVTPAATFYLGKISVDAVITAINSPTQTNINTVVFLAIANLVLQTINSLFSNLAQHGYDIVKDLLTARTFTKVYNHAAELDLAYFESPRFHDELEKVRTGLGYRPEQAMNLVVEFLSSIAGLFSLSFLLVKVGWWAPLALIILSLPRLIYRMKFAYHTYSITDERTPQSRKIWQVNWLLTYKDAAAEIKTFGLKDYLVGIFTKINNEFITQNRALSKKQTIYSSFLDLFGNGSYYFLALVIIMQTIQGKLTIGDFTMLTGIIRQYQGVLQGIFAYLSRFYQNNLFLQHYFSFLEMKPKILSPKNPRKINLDKPVTIEFKDVFFGYDPAKPVLKNVNLKITNAKNFALVGENGAGKTTLIKLLLRLYDPTEGQILINNVDIREIDVLQLRQILGVIFQDFQRYEMTVRENIGFGDVSRISQTEKIIAAAKLAGADEFVEKMPNKYDSILGKWFENGVDLSGGEWQKIALARAFFSDAPVLIMDEPTSSLDPKSEYDVFRNLIAHTTHKSLILISHRFSTVRLADEIIVLDKGQIAEQGSHEELMKHPGKYAKLYNLQAKWYK
jgi:ATP-binding cassette subfamily B protein